MGLALSNNGISNTFAEVFDSGETKTDTISFAFFAHDAETAEAFIDVWW